MKTSVYVRFMVVASLAMAPLAAYSQDREATQACVNAFVAQHFPGQAPIVRLQMGEVRLMPLMMSKSSFSMKLVATNHASGDVLVTATCKEKRGVVTLTSNHATAVIASR